MLRDLRVRARSFAACAAFAAALTAGCGGSEPAPAGPRTPIELPAPDLKGAARDAQKIEKAVTPPVIVQPNVPAAPAPAPAPAPGKSA